MSCGIYKLNATFTWIIILRSLAVLYLVPHNFFKLHHNVTLKMLQTGVSRDRPGSSKPRVTTAADGRGPWPSHYDHRPARSFCNNHNKFPGVSVWSTTDQNTVKYIATLAIRAFRCHVDIVLTPVRRISRQVRARAHYVHPTHKCGIVCIFRKCNRDKNLIVKYIYATPTII